MIYDTFENTVKYFHKEGLMQKGLSFVQGFDPSQADGRYEIEGASLYALVSTYETSPPEERRFEAHRRYIDVQVVMDGEERIDVSLARDLDVLVEYAEAKDVLFHKPPADFASLPMRPGCFAVFYPQDVHRPGCHLKEKRRVRKIVLKVLIQ